MCHLLYLPYCKLQSLQYDEYYIYLSIDRMLQTLLPQWRNRFTHIFTTHVKKNQHKIARPCHKIRRNLKEFLRNPSEIPYWISLLLPSHWWNYSELPVALSLLLLYQRIIILPTITITSSYLHRPWSQMTPPHLLSPPATQPYRRSLPPLDVPWKI